MLKPGAGLGVKGQQELLFCEQKSSKKALIPLESSGFNACGAD
jgi:hypothetical protein